MRRLLPLLLVALVAVVAACSKSPSTSDGVTITATDSTCAVAQTTFSPGAVTFTVANKGSKVTEVYVYAGARIVTEVENIGPGTSRTMTANLTPGEYQIACKPGQTGDGIRTPITVTGSTTSESPSPTPIATVHNLGVTVTDSNIQLMVEANMAVGWQVRVEFDNKSSVKRELEIIDPNGKEVTAVEAESHGAATAEVKLTLPGTWTLKIEDTEFVQHVTVS